MTPYNPVILGTRLDATFQNQVSDVIICDHASDGQYKLGHVGHYFTFLCVPSRHAILSKHCLNVIY